MPITYLDHAATTPMRPCAVAAMVPYFSERFANPSGSHRAARDARRAVDEARDVVAAALGVAPGDVVFTSGGTEGDNAAVAGGGHGRGSLVVSAAAEHHAVLHSVERAAGSVVGVTPTGHVDLDQLAAALDHTVRLVTIMAVNNEVGTMTDLASVAALVRERAPQAVLHTDAVQAAAWFDLAGISALVDMLTVSAHKFGGPKGVGVLTVRPGTPFDALLAGGGQERDRRSGTLNVPGIAGLAAALHETHATRIDEVTRLAGLKARLLDGLARVPGLTETVPREAAVPGVAHVCIDAVESEALLFLLDEGDVCASAASACASGAMQSSHVLAAMGVPRERAAGALRLSLGHTTTEADIDRAVDVISAAVVRLRGFAGVPL